MKSRNIINLNGVTISNDGGKILENVNMIIDIGEFCYLIGKTGTGKSSLIHALYGAREINGGIAVVAGQQISELNHKTLPYFRRKIGMIFQDFLLFEEWTVVENLNFVLRATSWKDPVKIKEQVLKTLKEVGLDHKTDQRVYSLSGGEKQRLAVGRALINNPVLILADEPTGSLDPETTKEIMLLIRKLAKQNGTALLMATHDHSILRSFPGRVYECKDRTILEQF